MAEDEFDDALARGKASAAADAAALHTALGAAGASAEAREFLAKQSKLADLQMENFRLENENLKNLDQYELSHLRWRRFNDQMRGALQIVLVIVGVAILIACGAAVWNASQAEGLAVDAFSVPPQYAQAGMAGDVIADDLTNKIAAVRDFANAHSIAQSKDVKKERDEEIKVDIPDTGVSLGEVSRYLRSWLGHERHLSGNLRDTGDKQIVLTVALDGANARSFAGAPADIDKLEQEAAEYVFQSVDPSNYVLYLYGEGRPAAESLAAIQYLIRVSGSPGMLSDGYALRGNWTRKYTGDLPLAIERSKTAVAVDPKALPAVMEMWATYLDMGRDEDALGAAREMPSFRQEEQYAWKEGAGFAQIVQSSIRNAEVLTGDFARAAAESCGFCTAPEGLLDKAEYVARDHDFGRSGLLIGEASTMENADPSDLEKAKYFRDAESGNWRAALMDARDPGMYVQSPVAPLNSALVRTYVLPLLAVALAHNGDFATARVEIGKTAADCAPCVTARGEIDALEGKDDAAAWWFARAIQEAPSIPFAYADWGTMLLRKGDYAGAIAKFALSNQKGPHFADPLEMWGEALVRENRSDLALAKFAEAAKYAPNWGRLHLKWGEALLWSGDKVGAAKQFEIGAGLDLTPSEKSELARMRPSHG
jgi:tetratricopeptide (TPR) repeat protein